MAAGIARAARLLAGAGHVTVFSGAGISVESGIPPFRGAGGLWSMVDPGFMEIGYFRRQPGQSWLRIKEIFYDHFGSALPNDAHFGVAAMEKAGLVKAIITQNIDNLHQRAGSREVIEFHGNSQWLVCLDCREREALRLRATGRPAVRVAPAAACLSPISFFSARAFRKRRCSVPTRRFPWPTFSCSSARAARSCPPARSRPWPRRAAPN